MGKNKNTVRVETWTFNKGTKSAVQGTKIAVRNEKGQFNGATNFRGTRLK